MVEIRINATFLNCESTSNAPNQRYESWSMPQAHASLGIPRMAFVGRELRFPTAPQFCRDSEIAPTEELRSIEFILHSQLKSEVFRHFLFSVLPSRHWR